MIWVVSFHILWINICQGGSYSSCYRIFFNMKHKYLYCVKVCVHMRKKNLVMSRGTMWPDMGIQGIAGNRGSKLGEEDMLLSLFLFSCYVRAHRHSPNQVWTPPYRISLFGHLTLDCWPHFLLSTWNRCSFLWNHAFVALSLHTSHGWYSGCPFVQLLVLRT